MNIFDQRMSLDALRVAAINMSKRTKALPDPMTLSTVVLEVLEKEQSVISKESKIVLLGLASACVNSFEQSLPPGMFSSKEPS